MPPMGTRRSLSLNRRRSNDSNNNDENCINIGASQLNSLHKSYIGDIVWIRHNNCLDTPAIIENISNGIFYLNFFFLIFEKLFFKCNWIFLGAAHIRNVMNDTVISINGKYLSQNSSALNETRQRCNLDTLKFYRQYNYRKAIDELIKAIEESRRLKFCAEELPKILNEGKNGDYEQLMKRIRKCDNKKHIVLAMLNVYDQLENDSSKISIDEKQSIAMKILCDKKTVVPLIMPDCNRVCDHCCKPGSLFRCAGSCEKTFHRDCIGKRNPNLDRIDWKQIEQQTKKQHSSIDHTTRKCMQCKALNNNPVDMNNNTPGCMTCTLPLNLDSVKCIECPAVFHLDSACIPAGAFLLSKSQLICGIHSELKRQTTSMCSVCFKGQRTNHLLAKCTKCANQFHYKCNRTDKCQQCLTNNRCSDIVYAYTNTKMWCPAIVVRDDQVPDQQKTNQQNNMTKMGTVFIFNIEKTEYERVYVKNLLRFPIDARIEKKIRKKNITEFNDAVEIATALHAYDGTPNDVP